MEEDSVGFLDYFKTKKPEKNSASIAKERLQIIVAHQRSVVKTDEKQPEYIALMQKEIMDVIKKYVHVANEDIKIELDSQGDCSVLELNVTIPESAQAIEKPTKKANA